MEYGNSDVGEKDIARLSIRMLSFLYFAIIAFRKVLPHKVKNVQGYLRTEQMV